ncbi:beta-1,3-galactosyl-O-glycosyl-glycoprotein beta-1,6-N-acetylglucosaminyltransferase 7 [Anolis carolinensis]|uniref:Glucosaminyl (N-acetyl) transferase family member 7 n=1 Tax=Anolis carolinensis TaxID=28377 RepID=R4G9Q3_ANOCA|nr:PREDICTED: beta-1,3-galactosyl-O-glycosyl-glycoprotein beta-1,6-N-acetylglucosaminyltransferase 7 [Anolis carolinensis]XP_008113452.1 PREDICTED: beta-1,3-galactosyl-O-glycosyl-glycoprotein beta-1,6-N-acetylglucosaminyltransferase 7 [Anolis carolinensis]XP_008113453.1 PREDICTED: beta-1,3-galactosyl-O-glycosyl-glycoprotein beta-1,6-N-acetylglucosaminyltransferase 7 [Anolis carolinensis]XP_008113454.1 PREDICTED: beta-1,3-galactosyl-O-glycosyl-glycoprotein beta-1,6-N-acetylglucosaminyltransferase|eukprot:XP_003223777.1 PREDICTED: beta-1,3-galactosyl-O-glycosyl-glycoprotein beta-1,6-N-acetylglucosaminyltransferase 7 [Anolis carolinensis]
MNLLEAVKSGFLVCIMGCILIFGFLYVRDAISKEEQDEFSELPECGSYPDELCSALFDGKGAASQVGRLCEQHHHRQKMLTCIQTPCNCSTLQKKLHFITSPLSEEEKNFSLAYIITIHKELDMFIKLIRAIYLPQNIYCIHIDEKSPKDYKLAVETLVNCFENIFIVSKTETVVYAGFSRLQADINCMKDLIHSKYQWNYVINLCGQDYPIKTNKEIIQYIKSKWNGKNMTPGIVQPPHMKHRTHVSYKEYAHSGKSYVYPTKQIKSDPPHNLTIYFGGAYYVLTRKFVEFTLTDIRAKDLLEWSRDTYSPDEHYWVTLNRLPDAPGATPDLTWEGNIRAIKWRDQEGKMHDGCKGLYVRDICVYGLGDLKWIAESPHLFANKFETAASPLVMECLERHFRQKVLQQAEVPLEEQWRLEGHESEHS